MQTFQRLRRPHLAPVLEGEGAEGEKVFPSALSMAVTSGKWGFRVAVMRPNWAATASASGWVKMVRMAAAEDPR